MPGAGEADVSTEPYPDRDAWPGYWRAIRTAGAWMIVIVIVFGIGAFIPRPEGRLPAIAIEMVIGLLIAVIATTFARRVNAWWDRRQS
jgi:hypothetical protein